MRLGLSRRGWLILGALLGTGLVIRLVLAFATYGVQYDIVSLETVAHALRSGDVGVYQSVRWPHPGGFLPFWRALLNSFAIAIPGTVIPILMAAAAAYAFAWIPFKGRSWIFIPVVALMAVPECNVAFAGDHMLKYSRADISVARSQSSTSRTFWPICRGSITCMLGKPSRKMMRSTILSACSISSIDSLRHFLAKAL